MPLEIKDVDARLYEEHLAGFLPAKVIDVHVHVWLRSLLQNLAPTPKANWAQLVAEENSIQELERTYELLLPQQSVTPLVFGFPGRGIYLDKTNDYVRRVAQEHKLPSLMVSSPEWASAELERRVIDGRFVGLKPYQALAPSYLDPRNVTIFDFLPHHHLEVVNDHKWMVMLHIPGDERLKDRRNLEQMLEIEQRYPDVQLIIAHVGRAYCEEDVGDAFEVLKDTERMLFDFSANTNTPVMTQLIRAVGPKRVLFGSDLPILRMRMRRICEDGVYINLVPPGRYGDISGTPHMREVSQEEGETLSFFLYEELLAFRRTAEKTGLSTADVEDVFYNNAARLFALPG
jgi:predicted TIM-barrel fold metal-dependent hydrolase